MKQTLQKGFGLLIAITLSNSIFFENAKAQSENDLLAKNVSLTTKDSPYYSNLYLKDSASFSADYVNDNENIYSESELQFLKVLIADFESETSIKINLITFDFSMIEKNDSSESGFSFPEIVNSDKSDYNKVIVKICADRRMMQIDGCDKTHRLISPRESKKIINSAFIPYFEKRKIFEGSINGLKKLMKELRSKKITQTFSE